MSFKPEELPRAREAARTIVEELRSEQVPVSA